MEKKNLDIVKMSDVELMEDGSMPEYFELACWLLEKGLLVGLAASKTLWSVILKRLEIARPYAMVAAKAIAIVLGMNVVVPEGFKTPYLEKGEGDSKITLALYKAKEVIETMESSETSDMAIFAWENWYSRTIPGFRALSFLLLEGRSESDIAQMCLIMSHEQCKEMRHEHWSQYRRSFRAAIDRGDYLLAISAAGVSNRDAEEHRSQWEMLAQHNLLDLHFKAEESEALRKAINGGLSDEDRISSVDGVPVAPTEDELADYIRDTLEGSDWSWNFTMKFLPSFSNEEVADLTGLTTLLNENKLGDEIEAEGIIADLRELPEGILMSPYKDMGFKEYKSNGYTPKTHNLAQAFWVKAAEAAGCFNEALAESSYERNSIKRSFSKAVASEMTLEDGSKIPAMGGYAKALFKKSGKRLSAIEPISILTGLIPLFWSRDDIASLPDGQLYWISYPSFVLKEEERGTKTLADILGKSDTVLGVSIKGTGHNLFGQALMILRDKYRADIEAAKAETTSK